MKKVFPLDDGVSLTHRMKGNYGRSGVAKCNNGLVGMEGSPGLLNYAPGRHIFMWW